jgi:hypothetical protein
MEAMQIAMNASLIYRIEAMLLASCRINPGLAVQMKHAIADRLKVVSSSH